MHKNSIFREYFKSDVTFTDRFLNDAVNAVDVIIPIFNTNELFKYNLCNIYKQIPVKRLLIGDGGCTDDSVQIANSFPRVIIVNQKELKTLGAALKDLISKVDTELFVYLHSDVALPDGWFEEMYKSKDTYDWYESPQKATVMVEFGYDYDRFNRALSGAQMGKSSVLKRVTGCIDDDYLYRNEDIILAELVEHDGSRYGKVPATFHYHQTMNKKGELEPKYESVIINKVQNKQWEIDTYTKQVYGIVKYLQPNKKYLCRLVNQYICRLIALDAWNWSEYISWIKTTNKKWGKYTNRKTVLTEKVIEFLKTLLQLIRRK